MRTQKARELEDIQNGNMSTAQTPPPVTSLFDKTSVDSAASFMNLSSSEVALWPYSTISVKPALYLRHNKSREGRTESMYELQEGLAEIHPWFGQILDEISRLSIQDGLVRLDRARSEGFDQDPPLAPHSVSRSGEWYLRDGRALVDRLCFNGGGGGQTMYSAPQSSPVMTILGLSE